MNVRALVVFAAMAVGACAAGENPNANITNPEAPTALPAKPAKPVKPAKPKVTADQLLGQKADWLNRRLGKPGFTRRDGKAEIWQYKSASCVVNVFLYPGESSKAEYSVLHFNTRDLKGAPVPRGACLLSL